MKFQDIPQMTQARYRVDLTWKYLQDSLKRYDKDYGLDLDPDFQRAHVWTEAQQIAYVEYQLRGGISGKDIFFNCPGFQGNRNKVGPMVLVDGKQRLNAIALFLQNEIPAFGCYLKDYEDRLYSLLSLSVHINNLDSYQAVLQWYLDLNSGIAHTQEELDKVRKMMIEE
jgi:uncharacterized protein with ParB-like and HNH nuclease domain